MVSKNCGYVSRRQTLCQYIRGVTHAVHQDYFGFKWSTAESADYVTEVPTVPWIEQMILDMIAEETTR